MSTLSRLWRSWKWRRKMRRRSWWRRTKVRRRWGINLSQRPITRLNQHTSLLASSERLLTERSRCKMSLLPPTPVPILVLPRTLSSPSIVVEIGDKVDVNTKRSPRIDAKRWKHNVFHQLAAKMSQDLGGPDSDEYFKNMAHKELHVLRSRKPKREQQWLLLYSLSQEGTRAFHECTNTTRTCV